MVWKSSLWQFYLILLLTKLLQMLLLFNLQKLTASTCHHLAVVLNDTELNIAANSLAGLENLIADSV